MIKGNSAINYEGEKQNTTPFIKAELKQNSIGISLPTGQVNFNPRYRNSTAIMYNNANWLLLGHASDVGLMRSQLISRDYLTTGYSASSFVSIDANALTSDLYSDGATAVAFFSVYNSGAKLSRRTSYGGTVWGVSTDETVYSGASLVLAIAATSNNRVYSLEVGTTLGASMIFRAILKCSEKTGVTWETETLKTKPIILNHIVEATGQGGAKIPTAKIGNFMVGDRNDNEDVLLINTSGVSTSLDALFGFNASAGSTFVTTSRLSSMGVRMIRTDGLNVFEEKDITDTRTPGQVMQIDNFAKGMGMSNWYLNTEQSFISYDNQSGVTSFTVDKVVANVMRSGDLQRWGNPVSGNLTSGASITDSLTDSFSRNGRGIIFNSGACNLEYGIWGDTNTYEIQSGASALDVSDDIISYSNKNNDRISLQLGNYKPESITTLDPTDSLYGLLLGMKIR